MYSVCTNIELQQRTSRGSARDARRASVGRGEFCTEIPNSTTQRILPGTPYACPTSPVAISTRLAEVIESRRRKEPYFGRHREFCTETQNSETWGIISGIFHGCSNSTEAIPARRTKVIARRLFSPGGVLCVISLSLTRARMQRVLLKSQKQCTTRSFVRRYARAHAPPRARTWSGAGL